MVLYNVKDINEMAGILDGCKGRVELEMVDGGNYDWKTNRELIVSLMKTVPLGAGGAFKLHIGNGGDAYQILKHMMDLKVS